MVNLLFFFAFMPYISFGLKAPSNIQPYFLLIGWVAAIAWLVKKNFRVLVANDTKILFVIGVFLVVYINPMNELSYGQWLRKSWSVLLILGSVFVFSASGLSKAKIPLLAALSCYSLFSLLHYLHPAFYLSLSGFFVELRDVEIGIRGTASLAPEATDMSFTMVYLGVFTALMKHHKLISKRLASFCFLLCVLNVFASLAISGFVALFGLLTLWIVRNDSLKFGRFFLILVVIVFFSILSLNFDSDSDSDSGLRVMDVLFNVVTDPSLILETSFAHRFVHLYVGVIAIMETSGLGFGAGSFTEYASDLFVAHNVSAQLSLNSYYSFAVWETLKESPVSMIGMLMFEYGVFGIVVVLFLITIPLRSTVQHKSYLSFMIFLTLFQSFPLSYPLMWVIIGYVISEKTRYESEKIWYASPN